MTLTKEQARARVKELQDVLDETFGELSQLAVEHELSVYVDGPAYGMGGRVVTKDGEYGSWEDFYKAGQWLASSNSC